MTTALNERIAKLSASGLLSKEEIEKVCLMAFSELKPSMVKGAVAMAVFTTETTYDKLLDVSKEIEVLRIELKEKEDTIASLRTEFANEINRLTAQQDVLVESKARKSREIPEDAKRCIALIKGGDRCSHHKKNGEYCGVHTPKMEIAGTVEK